MDQVEHCRDDHEYHLNTIMPMPNVPVSLVRIVGAENDIQRIHHLRKPYKPCTFSPSRGLPSAAVASSVRAWSPTCSCRKVDAIFASEWNTARGTRPHCHRGPYPAAVTSLGANAIPLADRFSIVCVCAGERRTVVFIAANERTARFDFTSMLCNEGTCVALVNDAIRLERSRR